MAAVLCGASSHGGDDLRPLLSWTSPTASPLRSVLTDNTCGPQRGTRRRPCRGKRLSCASPGGGEGATWAVGRPFSSVTVGRNGPSGFRRPQNSRSSNGDLKLRPPCAIDSDSPRLMQTGTVALRDDGRVVPVRRNDRDSSLHKCASGSKMTCVTLCVARQREVCSGAMVVVPKTNKKTTMLLKTLPADSCDARHSGHTLLRAGARETSNAVLVFSGPSQG